MVSTDALLERRTDFLDRMMSISENDYVEVKDFATIPGGPYTHSRNWAEIIFKNSRGPENQTPTPVRKYYLAKKEGEYDFLYHQYFIDKIMIQLRECSTILCLFVNKSDLEKIVGKEKDPLITAQLMCDYFLKVPKNPVFKFITDDSKYKTFSSNSNLTLTQIDNWHDRIDGYIIEDTIGIVIYKMQWDMNIHTNPKKWFPEDFRQQAKNK